MCCCCYSQPLFFDAQHSWLDELVLQNVSLHPDFHAAMWYPEQNLSPAAACAPRRRISTAAAALPSLPCSFSWQSDSSSWYMYLLEQFAAKRHHHQSARIMAHAYTRCWHSPILLLLLLIPPPRRAPLHYVAIQPCHKKCYIAPAGLRTTHLYYIFKVLFPSLIKTTYSNYLNFISSVKL